MELKKQGDGLRMEFSAISGYNYYSVPDPLPEGSLFLVKHGQTGETYRMQPGPWLNSFEAEEQIRWYRDFVLKPAPKLCIEWPVDLVRISFGQGFAARERLYYVFLHRPMPELETFRKFLYQDRQNEHLDWRNEPVRRTAVSFLKAMEQLHDSGYTYNDFNIRRICRDSKSGRVYLRFTDGVRRAANNNARNQVDPAKVAVEFAPPCPGVDRDLYAVAAILFRMMIGRLPYQGWPIEHNAHVFDTNFEDLEQERAYRLYFERYHGVHCFVFDPDDDSNRLSSGSEDDRPRERWKALPERIKTMFIHALAYTDPQKQSRMVLYTPRQWLAELEACCWRNEEGRSET